MSYTDTELHKLSLRIAALEDSTPDHLKPSPLVEQNAHASTKVEPEPKKGKK